MKNMIKKGLVAVALLSFAACNSNKNKPAGDTVSVKIDSTTKTSIDSTKKDAAKMDTSKKDTAKKM